MCQVLGVSRQGYYHYRHHRENGPKDPEHLEMLGWIQKINESSKNTYRSRCVKEALNVQCFTVCRNKARKVMREAGVKVPHCKKCIESGESRLTVVSK